MTIPDPGPHEAADRRAAVAATADHVRSVLGTLRELDLDGVAPAAAYHPAAAAGRPEGGRADATV
ncbi:hypothetical protein [Streptomyces huiliensis]|uniref:hypothetical protein n=1 Tax=Streptomyces huiliensis TaxID=2876027 RepID=UPI001CBAF336|nr:hypothetical protein [Streptomyces huiliensis]MBZ4320941.1 hypothetical protein [Streptomyces huiliensis]